MTFLKNQLLTEPILQPFNPQQDLVITCDGSTLGYGWTLLQRGADNALHVVAYGGAQATTKASANYTAAELEFFERYIHYYIDYFFDISGTMYKFVRMCDHTPVFVRDDVLPELLSLHRLDAAIP